MDGNTKYAHFLSFLPSTSSAPNPLSVWILEATRKVLLSTISLVCKVGKDDNESNKIEGDGLDINFRAFVVQLQQRWGGTK